MSLDQNTNLILERYNRKPFQQYTVSELKRYVKSKGGAYTRTTKKVELIAMAEEFRREEYEQQPIPPPNEYVPRTNRPVKVRQVIRKEVAYTGKDWFEGTSSSGRLVQTGRGYNL